MTTNLTRRTALLGTVTLPAALAPIAALAQETGSVENPVSTERDPFVSAFCRYVDAEEAYTRSFNDAERLGTESDDYIAPFCRAADEARLAMAQTVPTTTLGLMLAISALLPVFGELKPGRGDNLFSFEDMEVKDPWTNGAGEALLRSLIAASDRILNNNEPEDV